MTRADKSLLSISDAIRSRPGSPAKPASPLPSVADGLELSDIIFKPLSFFRYNPANEIFRAIKTEQYFNDLERDIREAGQILEPILAMPDGLIISGESRFIVADGIECHDEKGVFARLPCRLILSPMSVEEQERRLYLANLSRFEVDEDTRLLLYARIWPGYFSPGDTVAPAPAIAEIMEATGKSKRQVIRDGALVREAVTKATDEGRQATASDIAEAREVRNEVRRAAPVASSAPVENPLVSRIRRIVLELMEKSACSPDDAKYAYIDAAEMIKAALG
jgi:hypothetical protein